LFVKEDKRDDFVREFTKKFGDEFLLLSKEKVLEMKLYGCGKEHKDFRDMLGDYLAVAIDDLSIFNSKEKKKRYVNFHAGLLKTR
jgi:hypothetical protein